MSIFSTSYSDSDIAQIQQLLENAEKVPVTCEREFSGIWFQSEDRNGVKVACAFYNFGHSIQSFFEKQTTGNDGKDL